MAEKKSLCSLLRRLLFSDANSRSEKKEKRQTWIFRLLKMKRQAPLSAPFSPTENPPQETAEQRNSAVSVTDIQSEHPKTVSQEFSGSNINDNNSQAHQQGRAFQDLALAATKIQAVFRGYLAKKALRALKGVVKLQAIIRGWAVRKQASNTLKCLQSIVSIHSEVCSKRGQSSAESLHFQEYEQDLKENGVIIDLNSQKRWNDSVLTREESKALFLGKREASIKRERIKEYYLNHRRSAETEHNKVYARRKYWLEQWVNSQLATRDDLWNLDGNLLARENYEVGGRLPNLKYLERQYQAEMSDSPSSRRSPNHRRQLSTGYNNSFAGSPTIPTYMAQTTSAKAKARSLSSPRIRPISFDVCTEITSPYKHKLSLTSSINSELTSSSWVGNPICSLKGSPYSQGLPSPIKSTIGKK